MSGCSLDALRQVVRRLLVPAPAHVVRGDRRGTESIRAEDTVDADYAILMERVINGKGVAPALRRDRVLPVLTGFVANRQRNVTRHATVPELAS